MYHTQPGSRSSQWPSFAVYRHDKIKATCIGDSLIISALLVIGILVIVGSSLGHGNALQHIGTIGKIGGGAMVGGALTIFLADLGFHLYDRSILKGKSTR